MELSEPQFDRDSHLDDSESPMQALAQHPHIIYPINISDAAARVKKTQDDTIETSAVQEASSGTTEQSTDRESSQDLDHDHSEPPQGLVIAQDHNKHAHHHQQYHHQQPQSGTQCLLSPIFDDTNNVAVDDDENRPNATTTSDCHRASSSSATCTEASAQSEFAPKPPATASTSDTPTVPMAFMLRGDSVWPCTVTQLMNEGLQYKDKDDDDDLSDEAADSITMGAKKRSTDKGGAAYDSMKKRRRSKGEFGKLTPRSNIQPMPPPPKAKYVLPKRQCRLTQVMDLKNVPAWPSWPPKHGVFDFNISKFDKSTTSATATTETSNRKRQRRAKMEESSRNFICRQTHAAGETCRCRKRAFIVAIELSRPLSACSRETDQHPGWIESIKKRKIHQQATKWTSTLAPPPYLKLLTMRDFWDVMDTRMEDQKNESTTAHNRTSKTLMGRTGKRTTVRQYSCPMQSMRGLWEEELRMQRERQMIPDTVRRPLRNKIFNARPIATTTNTKPVLPSLIGSSSSSTTSSSSSSTSSVSSSSPSSRSSSSTTTTSQDLNASDPSAYETQEEPASQPTLTELDLSLKKKHRAAVIVRSHAISEGSDMSEYKPWKDGTVTPKQGSLMSLKELRCNIMDPWPLEESKSRDECTRILHRMREQLNIVINLQSQVSIELLLALYGPHFMQTSSFRAIEQLLWGAKGHSQTQPHADTTSAAPPLVQA
ncbi:hypothetical protein BGX31_008976 [Mortierella sp. GBA43]|nr:hypothetical protein BGX31_008976 [Mortierella sp. GBA43]